MYVYFRPDTTISIVSTYKVLNHVWLHVSAAHAAIIRPALKHNMFLNVRTIWDPICLHVLVYARLKAIR